MLPLHPTGFAEPIQFRQTQKRASKGSFSNNMLLLCGVDADGLLTQMAGLETDYTIDLGEQSVILADTDVFAGMEVSAALTNQDIPGQHCLTICLLGSKTLAFAVSAVTGGTHSLFMGKKLQIHRKHSLYLPV